MAANQQSEDSEFVESYKQIKSDVKKVIITNLLIIILLVILYFVNRKIGLVDRLEKYFWNGAYSIMAERRIRIAQAAVRFRLGP